MRSPTSAIILEGYKRIMRTKQVREVVIQTANVLRGEPTSTKKVIAKTEGKAVVAKRARAKANFIFAN